MIAQVFAQALKGLVYKKGSRLKINTCTPGEKIIHVISSTDKMADLLIIKYLARSQVIFEGCK